MPIFLKTRNIKIKASSFSDLWSHESHKKEYDNLITGIVFFTIVKNSCEYFWEIFIKICYFHEVQNPPC